MSRVVLLSRAADLNPTQRLLLLALRREAAAPTVRLGWVTGLVGLVLGLVLGWMLQ